MIVVRETSPNVFAEVTIFDVIESLDGATRAHLAVIASDAFTTEERAAFGVYLVEPVEVPQGKLVSRTRYGRVDGEVVQLLDLADVPVTVPATVSPRQLRLALLGAGKLDAIDAFVSGAGVPESARISWEYATEYRRNDPLLNAMAEELQPPLTGADIDRLFIAAAAIP